MDSPVSADSSTIQIPSSTSPSTGIISLWFYDNDVTNHDRFNRYFDNVNPLIFYIALVGALDQFG